MNKLYNIALGIFILPLLSLSFQVTAQDNCRENLVTANSLYDQGKLDEAIALVLPCTKSGESAELWQVYKLLAKSYLANNEEVKAREAAVNMMELNPRYEPNPRYDPKVLSNLIKNIDVIPKLSLGLTLMYGVNRTIPRITAVYAPSGFEKEYEGKAGAQFGVVAGYNFNKNHGIDLNVIFNLKKYGLSYSWDGNQYEVDENLTFYDFPLLYRYSFSSASKFRIGLLAGVYGSVLINSFNDLRISDGSANSEQLHYGSLKRRNSFNYGILGGIGANLKILGGHASLEARYYRSLKNITEPSSRYTNSTLIYDYLYLDDDILLDYVSLSVGYHFYIKYQVQQ